MITVYSQPNCTMCTATFRFMDRNKVAYITAEMDDELREIAQSRGITAAPLVVVEEDDRTVMWGGYNPDKIRKEIMCA